MQRFTEPETVVKLQFDSSIVNNKCKLYVKNGHRDNCLSPKFFYVCIADWTTAMPYWLVQRLWFDILDIVCSTNCSEWVNEQLMKRVSVQNMAAHLVSGARCHNHVTPVLHNLHCLPVWQQIKQLPLKTCPCLEVPQHCCSSICRRTRHTSGQHLRSYMVEVCVDWMHPIPQV